MIRSDYKYCIDYEASGSTDCENNGCDDEGICRCYTISSVDIKSVDVMSIAKEIFNQLFDVRSTAYERDMKINQLLHGYDEDVNLYCIDRILRIHKMYIPDNWDATWGGDYYGDEVHSIDMYSTKLKDINKDINKLISISSLKDKIEFLLIKEYGHLLDKLKGKEYKILYVNKSDIVFGQSNHKENVSKEYLEYYSDVNYDLTRGVCFADGDKWRVIDGYHRIFKTEKNKVKIIGVY